LPALRLLYHSRVFFIVAADRRHMEHVLTLEFLGQQNDLAHDFASTKAEAWQERNKWGQKLAEAAFQKVFPTRNQSHLQVLSLLEFLAYPGEISRLPGIPLEVHPSTEKAPTEQAPTPDAGKASNESHQPNSFYELLNELTADEDRCGDAVLQFARAAEQVFKLPMIMTFRAAEQLLQHVTSRPDVERSQLAYEVLSRLLTGRAEASVVPNRQGKAVGVTSRLSGEIAALYQLASREFGPPDVLLSARPDFVHLDRPGDVGVLLSNSPDAFDFLQALLAKTLEARGFAVDSGLTWNTYLSLIWTEWANPFL